MISVNLVQEIISLPKAGIWALINEKDRRIFLSFSNSMAGSLTRNLGALKDGSHRCKMMVQDTSKLSFKMIEEFSKSNVENRLRLSYWMDHFRGQGFEVYNGHVSIKMRVQKDLIINPNGVEVKLVNQRYKKIVVGFFKNIDEADRFIETNYRNGVYSVVFDDSPMTKRFLERSVNEDNFLD